MGIKTEEFVKNLPPKEITAGVEWLKILDSFDPTTLDQRYINECARRNPYDTCYKWDTPQMPVEWRVGGSKQGIEYERKNLVKCVERIENEGLTKTTYKQAREALIRAIGSKGAHEYNQREFDRLGEAGREAQNKEYFQAQQELVRLREEEVEKLVNWADPAPASIHEKIIRIRKGVKASNGKPLTQRDFAKFIGYPIQKYIAAEKVDEYSCEPESPVEDELLEKLIMFCHANPYWLFDSECESWYAHEDPNDNAVIMGDEPCVYAPIDIILQWILDGKPKDTCWEEGLGVREFYTPVL